VVFSEQKPCVGPDSRHARHLAYAYVAVGGGRVDIILGDDHGSSRDVVPHWRRKCLCYLVDHSERLARANDGHAPRVHMRTASGIIRQTWPWFAHLKRRGKNFLNGFEQNSFVIQPQ